MKAAAPWILAAFHLLFWRLLGWPGTLAASGAVNRGVTQILNLALTYLFGLAAAVCFLFAADIAATALGRFWLAAMAGFWIFIVGALVHGMAWATASSE